MYLVDTNVISALAPSKQGPASKLVEWLDRASPYLFLSVITVAEIQSGIARADRIGASAKATRLREWWGRLNICTPKSCWISILDALTSPAEFSTNPDRTGRDSRT